VRPGHADYTARIKYSGFNDYRGGGHFSGRLTAPLVFAGAIAKGILKQKEIYVGSHLASIGGIEDELFNPVDIRADLLLNLNAQEMPLLKKELEALITEKILEVKADSDSVGGIVETAVIGLQPGLGSPFFDSVESKIAHLIFSIPAVKGLEFGAGFRFGSLKGSQANDPFYWEEGKVKTKTNNCGGILGGITNGMPVIFRTAFKPTPSIGQTQETVDLAKKENTLLSIRGRHDPCLVLRAIPVVEALSSLAVVEMIIEKEGKTWF
jgi:chorismate synthase